MKARTAREQGNVTVPVKAAQGEIDPQALRMEVSNWIACLQTAERMGTMNDEPEGNRYIQISDTFAQQLVIVLQAAKELIPK